jgi:hypothetical protein
MHVEGRKPLSRIYAESIGKCRPCTVEYLEGLRCAADVTERADQRLGQFLLEWVIVEGRRQRLNRLLPPTAVHQGCYPVEQDHASQFEKSVDGRTVKGFTG